MARPAKATPLGIAVGVLSVLACGGSPSAPTLALYDGTWRGTTSQSCGEANCPLMFAVAGNAVTSVYLNTSVKVTGDAEGRVLSCDPPGTGPTAWIGEGCLEGSPCGTVSPPVPIEGTSFGIVAPNFSTQGTPLIDTMIGAFASPTSVSGSLSYTIRSVCVVRGALTWTATKQ